MKLTAGRSLLFQYETSIQQDSSCSVGFRVWAAELVCGDRQ